MDWVTTVIFVGVLHAVVLAAYAGLAAYRRSVHVWLPALFALFATVVTAILVTHRTEGLPESAAIAVEQLAALMIGPVMLAYIRDAIGRPIKGRWLMAHLGAPLVLWVGLSLRMISGGPAAPDWLIVGYELIYSIAGAIAFAVGRAARPTTARAYWWPLAVLVGMFSVHAGQTLRLIAPDSAVDVVPLLGAVSASLILLALVLTQAPRAAAAKYGRSTLHRDELQRIYDALVQSLDRPPPLYRKPDLGLSVLAAAAGVPSHHASQAISAIGGGSFYDLLTQRRVTDALERLLAPENARVAVEVLGIEAGFRSRSAFYTAIKEATGLTPAEYRRHHAEIVSKSVGEDHVAAVKP